MASRPFLAAAALFSIALSASGDSTVRGTGKLEEVVREINARQKKITTLQADFRQVKEMALLAKPQVSTGTFAFDKTKKVLWNYAQPRPVTMLIANGWLTTYYPDLKKAERVEVRRYQDRIFKYIGATSGALEEMGKYFDFTFVESRRDPFYTLELTPKSRTVGKRVRRIKIWIDRETYMTTRFEYVEGDGDVTRYEFSNIRVNAPLPADRFTLRLPPSTRIEQLKLD